MVSKIPWKRLLRPNYASNTQQSFIQCLAMFLSNKGKMLTFESTKYWRRMAVKLHSALQTARVDIEQSHLIEHIPRISDIIRHDIQVWNEKRQLIASAQIPFLPKINLLFFNNLYYLIIDIARFRCIFTCSKCQSIFFKCYILLKHQ